MSSDVQVAYFFDALEIPGDSILIFKSCFGPYSVASRVFNEMQGVFKYCYLSYSKVFNILYF